MADNEKLAEVTKIASEISGREALQRHLVESLARTCCAFICHIPDETKPDAKIVLTTEKLREMFGYPVGLLESEDIRILIPKRYWEKHDGHVVKFFKVPDPRQMGERHMDLVGVRRDGSEFPVEVSLDSEYIEHAGEKHLYITGHVMEMRGS